VDGVSRSVSVCLSFFLFVCLYLSVDMSFHHVEYFSVPLCMCAKLYVCVCNIIVQQYLLVN